MTATQDRPVYPNDLKAEIEQNIRLAAAMLATANSQERGPLLACIGLLGGAAEAIDKCFTAGTTFPLTLEDPRRPR